MRRQQTKQCAAWRCRREQYLRESGRQIDLTKEGYASAEDTTVLGEGETSRSSRKEGSRPAA
jgi:hypothetical protein